MKIQLVKVLIFIYDIPLSYPCRTSSSEFLTRSSHFETQQNFSPAKKKTHDMRATGSN